MAQQQIALEQEAGPYTQAGQDAADSAKSYSNDASAYQQELSDNCLLVD